MALFRIPIFGHEFDFGQEFALAATLKDSVQTVTRQYEAFARQLVESVKSNGKYTVGRMIHALDTLLEARNTTVVALALPCIASLSREPAASAR